MTTRTDFETQFTDMGRNIDELIADTREDLREERMELKEKWNALDTRRKMVADQDDSMWEKVKDELEDGWNTIKESYEDLKRRMRD